VYQIFIEALTTDVRVLQASMHISQESIGMPIRLEYSNAGNDLANPVSGKRLAAEPLFRPI